MYLSIYGCLSASMLMDPDSWWSAHHIIAWMVAGAAGDAAGSVFRLPAEVIHTSFYRLIYVSIFLPVCLSIDLSVYLSVYLSASLSICLSIGQVEGGAGRGWVKEPGCMELTPTRPIETEETPRLL